MGGLAAQTGVYPRAKKTEIGAALQLRGSRRILLLLTPGKN